jgi:hypothetical protein
MGSTPHEKHCTTIADRVVPEYRNGSRSYSCNGTVAKRWQAAWDAAHLTLSGESARKEGI